MESALTHNRDTICAVSTAPGSGGIAVIRVSGPTAIEGVERIWKGAKLSGALSHTVHLGTLTDPADGSNLDQAVAAVYRSPNSFTGDDVVELSVHGSPYVQRRLLRILIDHCGIRAANPGEFTMRAFSSGKLSLTQAEAVADIIASDSKAAHRIATTQFSGKTHTRLTQLREDLTSLAALLELELDFSEEDVEFADRRLLIDKTLQVKEEISRLLNSFQTGKAIKEGVPVAIAGATNAGKSSLLNQLLDDDRAIVSDIHGTTRDTIEATAEIEDYLFRFIDTAGLRATDDLIERLGIERSHNAVANATVTLLVIDSSEVDSEERIAGEEAKIRQMMNPAGRLVTLLNKTDIAAEKPIYPMDGEKEGVIRLPISAQTGAGIEELRSTLVKIMAESHNSSDIIITNERHRRQLQEALESITLVEKALRDGLSADLIAIDIRATIHHLSLLTGDITTSDLLTHIFSRFCIGK